MSKKPDVRTPSYRLHKPSGQAVVTLCGRDVYLGKHDSPESAEAYRRTIAEWLANGRQLQEVSPAGITICELMAAYLRFATGYYKKNGITTKEVAHIKNVMTVLKRTHGRTCVQEFGPLALKSVRQSLIETKHSRTYINDHVGRIKRMFKWGVENELVPAAIFHALQAVPGLRRGRSGARETQPVRRVPDEYVDAIRSHVAAQVWAMIELQRLTGMRSGEVPSVRGCDLDTTGSLWLYRADSHKTQHLGYERVIELGPRAQAVVKPFLSVNVEGYLFAPCDAVADRTAAKRLARETRVQPSQADRSKPNPVRIPGDHYSVDSYRRAIQRACKLANVPHWHPHRLRHSYATRIRKEYGVEAARILLGHRSTAVAELYAEVDRGRVRDIVARVG